MLLSPQNAAEMIVAAKSHGYLFYLPGSLGGKEGWTDAVHEELRALESEREIRFFGRYGLSLYPGDVANAIQSNRVQFAALNVGDVSNKSEIEARGIATICGLWFVSVDNFLTEDDQKTRPIIVPVGPPQIGRRAAIIVDLDGTLADSSHRRPYSATDDEIMSDSLIQHVANVVHFHRYFDHEVIYVTARGNEPNEIPATLKWLRMENMWEDNGSYHLFSRAVGDNRDDVIVKLEIFNESIRDKYNVRLVLDDRPKVVRMWTALGLPVLANQPYARGEF